MKRTYYNATDVYEENIRPLVNKLKLECYKAKIPFFLTVAVSNDELSTDYKFDGLLTGSLELKLTNDRFGDIVCVSKGIKKAVSPEDNAAFFDYVSDDTILSSE